MLVTLGNCWRLDSHEVFGNCHSERSPTCARELGVQVKAATFGSGSSGLREENSPIGLYPQYGWDFPEEIPEKFRKDPGNALRAFPGIPLKSTAGIPLAL